MRIRDERREREKIEGSFLDFEFLTLCSGLALLLFLELL